MKGSEGMNRTAITPEVFNKVKIMLNAGMKQKEIAQVMDISAHSIIRINNADSYEQHKKNVAVYRKNGGKSEDEQKPAEAKPTASDYYQINRMYEQQKRQTELLEQIAGDFRELLDLLR